MRNPNTLHPYKIPVVLALMAIAAILAFTTIMTVSAQSDDRDWKQSPTGLNVTAGDAGGKLNITWDAHPQTSKTLSDYRVTWTPDGESFKTNDHTEWYAYPTTNQVSVTGLDAGETYKVRVRARYDDNKKSRWSDVVSGQAGVTTNTPATGQPTIAGTVETGETLTAATSSISDDNGLANAAFAYQWIHTATDSEAYIPAATASSYLLSSDDLGHSIKVRVTFTDDDGYTERLTSSATALVIMQANVAATGQPTITGSAEVGETLTAATSAISDSNGITNAVFSHQWVRDRRHSQRPVRRQRARRPYRLPDSGLRSRYQRLHRVGRQPDQRREADSHEERKQCHSGHHRRRRHQHAGHGRPRPLCRSQRPDSNGHGGGHLHHADLHGHRNSSHRAARTDRLSNRHRLVYNADSRIRHSDRT